MFSKRNGFRDSIAIASAPECEDDGAEDSADVSDEVVVNRILHGLVLPRKEILYLIIRRINDTGSASLLRGGAR